MAVYKTERDEVNLEIGSCDACRLCLAQCSPHEMYELEDCKCSFCKSCVQQYLSVLIREGAILKVTCPDATCRKSGEIRATEIKGLVDHATYMRYSLLKFEKGVELDPNRMFCPGAGCETICHVCFRKGQRMRGSAPTPNPVHCPTCEMTFCSVCKASWHADQTCDDFMKTSKENDGVLFNNDENAKIKRCPYCYVSIERNDGCAQMMCKQCEHVFCWYCLASLEDDFLLRHYDKGPCKNKLGHSRASVIWHRTQVVGIFAGFSVLLLVASPLLLLTAPCLLCCKCTACSCCDDDDDPPSNEVIGGQPR